MSEDYQFDNDFQDRLEETVQGIFHDLAGILKYLERGNINGAEQQAKILNGSLQDLYWWIDSNTFNPSEEQKRSVKENFNIYYKKATFLARYLFESHGVEPPHYLTTPPKPL